MTWLVQNRIKGNVKWIPFCSSNSRDVAELIVQTFKKVNEIIGVENGLVRKVDS